MSLHSRRHVLMCTGWAMLDGAAWAYFKSMSKLDAAKYWMLSHILMVNGMHYCGRL